MSVHAYILAGGKSSRMGEDKGLLLFHDKPLIQYVINVFSEITENIFIVTSNKAYEKFGFPLIEDIKKELGPAGAIDAVLHHSTVRKSLIIACDMPFIDAGSINNLISESHHSEITVPLYHHYPEALFGIYDQSCKVKWRQLIERDVLKLSDLLSHFETNFVDGDRMCALNSKLFQNMNTKDDLNR